MSERLMNTFRDIVVKRPGQTEAHAKAMRRKDLLSVSSVCLVTLLLVSMPSIVLTNDTKPADGRAGDPRLVIAAEAKRWAEVASLVEQGAGINESQPDGMTALHWAVHHGDLRTVRLLIDAKCDVNVATRYEVTPLSIACQLGRAESVERLLAAGADVNAILPGGVTLLMTACRTGNAEVVRHLLKSKARFNAAERRGQTALMWAAAEGHAEVMDLLIKAGADVNASTSNGFSAIMFAARQGHIEAVKRLLAAGVDVNTAMHPKTKGNRTPRDGTSVLQLAVESGHFELALILVQNGADPNDQRSGFTPLHVLSWVRKPDRGENAKGDPSPRGSGRLTSLEFVRELAHAGANVNARLNKGTGGRAVLNKRGATPFLLAAKTADIPFMKLLLELGADPTIPNSEGSMPIMAAAGIGVRAVGEEAGTEPEVLEAIDFLMKLGADINAKDDNGETAMHGAAYRNFPRVVASLAKHGADPAVWNQKNKHGWTPEMIASGKRPGSFKPSPETIHALRAAMAVTED
ncbi:MAG: ankyrin repeat protein [Planctomycetaceae bacterium]